MIYRAPTVAEAGLAAMSLQAAAKITYTDPTLYGDTTISLKSTRTTASQRQIIDAPVGSTFESLNPSETSVTDTGDISALTGYSSIDRNILVTAPLGKRLLNATGILYQVPDLRINSITAITAGSVLENSLDQIATRISGKTGVTGRPNTLGSGSPQYATKQPVSTVNPDGVTFNPYFWMSGVDLSWWSYTRFAQAGRITAISPWHGIIARHYMIPDQTVPAEGNRAKTLPEILASSSFINGTVKFASPTTGLFETRSITDVVFLGDSTDAVVVKFNAPLTTITPAKVLPPNYQQWMPNGLMGGRLVVSDGDDRCCHINSINTANHIFPVAYGLMGSHVFDIPGWSEQLSFGDSSNWGGILVNGEICVFGHWTSASSTHNWFDFWNLINSAMTTLGGGYQLTPFDFSSFPTY